MFSSYTGTIFRALFIILSIISLWYLAVLVVYFLITLIFSLDFSFSISLGLFAVLVLGRMFYPKNVFV